MQLPGGGDHDGVHVPIPDCVTVTQSDASIPAQQRQSVGESGRAIHSESRRQFEVNELASVSQPSDSCVAAGRPQRFVRDSRLLASTDGSVSPVKCASVNSLPLAIARISSGDDPWNGRQR